MFIKRNHMTLVALLPRLRFCCSVLTVPMLLQVAELIFMCIKSLRRKSQQRRRPPCGDEQYNVVLSITGREDEARKKLFKHIKARGVQRYS